MDIELADTRAGGWQLWLDWHRAITPDNEGEIRTLEAHRGDYRGDVPLVDRRGDRVELSDRTGSAAVQDMRQPFRRSHQ